MKIRLFAVVEHCVREPDEFQDFDVQLYVLEVGVAYVHNKPFVSPDLAEITVHCKYLRTER